MTTTPGAGAGRASDAGKPARAEPGDTAMIGRRAFLSGAATVGLGALVAACSTPPPATPASAPAVPQAAELRAAFQATTKELLTPGAAMMLRTPDGVLTSTYGFGTDTGAAPVSLAEHVRIGSITKTFTGTVILRLAQEGKLNIDAPVAEYYRGVPNGEHIPLTQLLDMRSGLYNYSETVELNRSLDEDPGKVWTPEELLALAFAHPPYFPPGAGYHYSNTNTVLLGLIIEKVDARPLASAYQTRLFTPLGLRETSLPPADSAALPAPHPRGYMYGTNVATMHGDGLPPDQRADAATGAIKPNDVTDENPSWAWAAGGAISTVGDLVTWATALGDGSLLDPTWQRRRLDSVRPVDPNAPSGPGYGLGIAKFGPMYGHTGDLPGFQSFAGYDPEKKIALAVWANLNAAPDGRAVANTITQRLIGTLYG